MKKQPWYYFPLALALSAISGVLLAFSSELSILGWVAFVPLLVAARIERPITTCLCGVITAIVCGKICGGQLTEAYQYGNLVAAFGSLALVFAFVAVTATWGRKKLSPALWPFFVACSGVIGELFAAELFPVSIALSQHQNPAALHLVSLTGIWGVTFLLWLVSAGVILLSKPKSAASALIVAVLVVGGAWIMPHRILGHSVTVAAVQAPDEYSAAEETTMISKGTQVVVWPELLMDINSPLPSNTAKRSGVFLVASVREPNPKGKPYNTASLSSPSGERIGMVRKQHLFGKERFYYSPGLSSRPISAGRYSIGAPICFDTTFTDITRDLVKQGADILLVPNSDPDLPNCMFNNLHSAMVAFRAAENGVPIAWSERNSASAIIDSNGRVIARAPNHKMAVITGTVHLRKGHTLFTRLGDYFADLCIVSFILIIVSILCNKGRMRSAA